MMEIEIEIRLFLGLNKYLPPGDGDYSRGILVAAGSTAGEVLHRLGVPEENAPVVMVNGATTGLDHVLKNGDVLVALPPAGGG